MIMGQCATHELAMSPLVASAWRSARYLMPLRIIYFYTVLEAIGFAPLPGHRCNKMHERTSCRDSARQWTGVALTFGLLTDFLGN